MKIFFLKLVVATWIDLEIIVLSKVGQTEKDKYSSFLWNLKNSTNGVIYKTKTVLQTDKTNFWLPKGKGSEG